MKATNIIATIAATLLLFASVPTVSAQRGPLRQNQSQGTDNRGVRSSNNNRSANASRSQAGPSRNENRQAAAPQRSQGQPSKNNRPVGHGGNPVRNAKGGTSAAAHHNAPAPRHEVRHNAPVHHAPAQVHHHAPAPVHHAPAPAHHHAPAPRVFTPRHYGPKPIYHRNIDSRARVFYIDDCPYYSYGGVYYRYVPSYGYQEIYMPEDVVVTELPYGASRVYVNNIRYYEADGMWFQPVDGGYLLIERPAAHVTVTVPRPTVSFHASFGF